MSDPLIVLGIDGLDWDFIDGHRELLPNLASFPTLSPLPSIFPPDSLPAWTTIFTGIPPGEHGYLDSIDYLDSHPSRAADEISAILPHRTFWDEAGKRGARVCIVNPFLAYPAWPVNGVMVSGPVFVSGEISVYGIDRSELGDVPELGGIVTFPTERTMGPFVEETLRATEEQAEFGMRLFGRTKPDLFFLNILTIDRMQHFAWRFHDEADPTYPGPTPHQDAVLRAYLETDDIIGRYAKEGRVLVLSDHGHGRRCTRMVFVDEALRRAGLLAEARSGPLLASKAFWLERAKRVALSLAFRYKLESSAYRLARRLPNRQELKKSTFSSTDDSPARLSRTFGRNRFGGVDLASDTPDLRGKVAEVLQGIVDDDGPVMEWVMEREQLIQGTRSNRYPPVLFRLREGYGVDFGIYGNIFAPDVNHRRISGGHKEDGIIALSFEGGDVPGSLAEVHDFVLRQVEVHPVG